jgi:hypothetical protein
VSTESAHTLDQQIRAARARHHQAEHELAVLLARMADDRLFLQLGYSSVHHYAEQVLDLTPRQVRDLVHIGRRLPDLPVLADALKEGRLGWTKARELLRVITAENEAEWVDRAADITSRALEHQIAGTPFGDPPPGDDDEPHPKPARRRLVFELESTDAEVVERAMALLRARAGDLDRGAALLALARQVLADDGPDAPSGEAPYQVVLQHCPSCERTVGMDCEVSDTIVSEAGCDHDVIEMEGPQRGRRTRAVPPTVRRATLAAWGSRCAVPGCSCTLWVDLHHVHRFADGGSHEERNLVPICTIHHRLIHEGVLALWLDEEGLHAEFGDGRHAVRRAPRGSPQDRQRRSEPEAAPVA